MFSLNIFKNESVNCIGSLEDTSFFAETKFTNYVGIYHSNGYFAKHTVTICIFITLKCYFNRY